MQLQILSGSGRGELLELSRTQEEVFGRDPSCDHLIRDPKASRRHCAVRSRGSDFWVEDLGSSNGTWVNGDRISERRLVPGDVLKIADTVLEVVGEDAVGEDAAGGELATVAEPSAPAAAEVSVAGATAEGEGERPQARRAMVARRPARGRRPMSSIQGPLVFAVVASLLGAGVYLYLSERRPFQPAATQPPLPSRSAQGAPREAGPPPWDGRDGSSQEPREVVDPDLQGTEEGRPAEGEGFEEDDFRRALRRLRERAADKPTAELQAEIRRLVGAARGNLREVLVQAEKLTSEGRYDEARELIHELLPTLPEEMVEVALSGLGALTERERKQRGLGAPQGAGFDDSFALARYAMAQLDFAASLKIIQRAVREPSAGESEVAAHRALMGEMETVRGAWLRMESALKKRAGAGSPSELRWQEQRMRIVVDPRSGDLKPTGEPPPAGDYTVVGLRGETLRLRGDKGPVFLTDAFALSDDTLRQLLLDGDAVNGGRWSEGLALLLLYREGPERARSFLSRGDLPEAGRAALLATIRDNGEIWLEARRRRVERDLKRRGEAQDSDDRRREDLDVQAAELAVLWKDRQSFVRVRRDLEGLFRKARLEALVRAPPTTFFHAASVRSSQGRIELVYDFSTQSQLADFQPLEGSSVRVARNALLLRGECRLFDRMTFLGSLRVRLQVPPGGYAQSSPNINVALWTSGDAPVAPQGTMTLTRSLLSGGEAPADYVVFGTGYRTAVSEYGGSPLEEVKPAASQDFVKLPANVLFAGQQGRPLHSDPAECVWARSLTGGRLSGAISIEVALDERTCVWQLNRRPVLPEAVAASPRLYLGYPRIGSMSLFTFDRELRIASLEVEGQLNPVWVETALASRVSQEFARLLK